MSIGRIERVELREVWRSEPRNFTTWLQDNLDVLNEHLDFELTQADREQPVGTFNVDLIAMDTHGRTVAIENQLGKSDHDHLGKLVTYLSNIEAKVAIWIVSNPRPEHVTAINWLNQYPDVEFYLFKLEAVKIADSQPAPLLTLIAAPSDEVREVGSAKMKISESQSAYRRFWTTLLERARARTKLHSTISPSDYLWIGTSSGKRGLGFNYVIWKQGGAAELYIDRGKGAGDENKTIFDTLFAEKAPIEKEFGGTLEWQRLDSKRACRIRIAFDDLPGLQADPEEWSNTQDAMIDAMIRLEKALAPRIAKLRIN
jgi:hypothetical protein